LVAALRTLGLFGPASSADQRLERFEADDGQAIPVRVLGDGPPVVLVHGLGCSHRVWLPVARRLGRRHRVLAWDARGHGQCLLSPGRPVTLKRLSLDLRQLIEHFDLQRPVLVGHSMGALTVMQYLRDHGSDGLGGVAFVDQSPRIVTDETWRYGLFGGCSEDMLMGLIGGARRDLAETVAHEVEVAMGGWLRARFSPNATLGRWLRLWLRRLDTSALLDLAESLALADFRHLMSRLDLPVWVVLGGRSAHYAEVPLETYYRRVVPHASVQVFARSGHSPHVAEPARFAQELMRFLDEHA
jgi:pimeloyl-ACP methyl ester carboxylesterase